MRWFDQMRLRTGDVAIDAGTGMGEVARMRAARGAPRGRVVGVDLSADLLQRARDRAAGIAEVEYQVADLTALPFDPETLPRSTVAIAMTRSS